MKQSALILLCMLARQSTPQSTPISNPATFWKDYPACEQQCHQNIYGNQSCTLQNSCGCSGGCLCLDDDCLCATPSWLIVVSQCVGKECGPAAVTEAASIASSGCGSYGLTLAVNPQSLIQEGLAAVSSSVDSSESTATQTQSTSPTTTESQVSGTSGSTSFQTSQKGPTSAVVNPSVSNPTSVTKISSSSTSSPTPVYPGLSSTAKHGIEGGVIGGGIGIGILALIFSWLFGFLPKTRRWASRKELERFDMAAKLADMNRTSQPIPLDYTQESAPDTSTGYGLDLPSRPASLAHRFYNRYQFWRL